MLCSARSRPLPPCEGTMGFFLSPRKRLQVMIHVLIANQHIQQRLIRAPRKIV